jgi:hypothetical protein
MTKTTKPTPAEPPKIGRPKNGKRSDGVHRQVSAWVQKDTYARVQNRLFNRENRMEFSVLVEDLLKKWLKEKRG